MDKPEETPDTGENQTSHSQPESHGPAVGPTAGQVPAPVSAGASVAPPGFVPLEGSDRFPLAGAVQSGAPTGSEIVKLSVYLRPRELSPNIPTPEEMGEIPPQLRSYATPAQIDAIFSADPAELERVAAYAASKGLEVVRKNLATRTIQLQGPATAAVAAFPTQLADYEHASGRYRGRSGPIYVPAEFDGVIENIFGFDNRPVGVPNLRRGGPIASRAITRRNAYFPPQVAQLYNFPQQQNGSGQCIGILVLNGTLGATGIVAPGGYSMAALQNYFQNTLKMNLPQITDVVVHGPGNSPNPNDPNDVSDEVMLDIQIAGSCAPGARLVMYFTEFTEQGWVDAITTAVHDTQNNPTVLTISYGNPEDVGNRGLWTTAAIQAVNQAFQIASYKGITVCCAAGDQGSSDLDPSQADGNNHVDFPASSPYVLSCGGTRLESANGVITRETVWNNNPASATGGGVSALFPMPDYQRFVTVPRSADPGHRIGRAVPDVSGLADPDTGVLIMNVDGTPEPQPVGGTSMTAPLWAALVARINQALGVPLGFLNPILYKYCASGVLRDITIGDNGAYAAGPGYDAVTGLGSIDGARLLAALVALGSSTHVAPPTSMVQPPSTDDRLVRLETYVRMIGEQQQTILNILARIAAAAHIPLG
jgi:kumamolisin